MQPPGQMDLLIFLSPTRGGDKEHDYYSTCMLPVHKTKYFKLTYQMVDKTSCVVVLKPYKTSSLLVCGVYCFSCMLISSVHKSIIVMNSPDTRFSRNVFEAIQKTHSTCFIRSKTTRLCLVVLNPDKTLLRVF